MHLNYLFIAKYPYVFIRYFTRIIFIFLDLTFVFPCIASTITIDNKQDANVLVYLL